jgi:hypothetical protein
MQNILQIQDDLKNFSQQQLVAAMQNPTGGAPQFLVLSELNRRKRVKEEQQRQEAANQMTVAEEAVMAAGMPPAMTGQMAKAMAPKSNVAENTGIAAMAPKQPTRMAEGGVVKAQPGGFMGNVLSLMNPYSVKNITDYNPTVAKEPEQTGLEELEVVDPDIVKALEVSKKIQAGKAVKSVLKEAGLTALEAANLVAGAGLFISADTANAVLNTLGLALPDDEARILFKVAQSIEDRAVGNLFKEDGNWLQRNLPRFNPDFAYNFKDRKTKAEELSAEDLEAIRKRSEAAIRSAAEEGGDKTVFAEGTPSVPITGTYTLPRGTNQVGDPMVGGPNKPVIGQRTAADLTTAPQTSTADDRIKTGAGFGLGLDTQASPAAPNVASQDPFRLEGAAKEEQLRSILSDPNTKGIVDYLDKVQNDENMNTGFRKNLRDGTLNLDMSPSSTQEFFPSKGDIRSKETSDLNERALQFLKTDTFTPPSEIYGNTDIYGPELAALFDKTLENQQKAMPGGGGRSGLGALFAQTLENQQEGIPGGTDPNAKPTLQSRFDRAKLYLEGLGQDISNMTQEDVIDFAKKAGMKGLELVDDAAQAGSDMLTTRANNRASAAFDSDTLGVGSEPPNFKEIDKATVEKSKNAQEDIDNKAKSEIDKLTELFTKQQEQASASDMTLSKYLEGLDKDRESSKWLALARAGAELMKPSASIGEGIGKATEAGLKSLQGDRKSYNKNKLQILALQGRIDAQKAAAANRSAIAGASVSSRILLQQREDLQNQLQLLNPGGGEPRADLADRVAELKQAIREKDDQLNALITTSSLGSIGTGNDIFASYNLTG